MSVPDERPYRRRRSYRLGAELSGLERPRQWLGAIAGVVTIFFVLYLITFLAFR